MKKILILLLLSLTLACSNDDDNPNVIVEYQLTQYAAGFINATNFADSDVNWSFNHTTGKLTVVNNVSGTYPSMITSGTYDFTLENDELSFMAGMRLYVAPFTLSNNEMTLNLFFENDPLVADDEEFYLFDRK